MPFDPHTKLFRLAVYNPLDENSEPRFFGGIWLDSPEDRQLATKVIRYATGVVTSQPQSNSLVGAFPMRIVPFDTCPTQLWPHQSLRKGL